MQRLPSDMDELLAIADGVHRGTGHVRAFARLLRICEPSFLLLADVHGEVIFADDLASEMGTHVAHSLAKRIVKELVGRQTCRFEMAGEAGCHLAVAIRCPDWAEAGIAGCLVRPRGDLASTLSELETSILVCTAFAFAACHNEMHAGKLRARLAYIQAKYETLKNAQAQAVAAAINEHEKRLQQQRQNVARLEAVMKLAADGIVTVNEAGTIESFNEAAGRIFGYDPKEVMGQNISMLEPDSDYQGERAPLVKHLNGGKPYDAGSPRELTGRRKDGTLFPIEITVSEVSLDSGWVLMGIFRDISERRQLERQLLQAQKMESVGQLAAGIAHEINTPTQYVGDNTRFLEDVFRDLAPLLADCSRLCKAADEGEVPRQLVAGVVAAAKEADLEYLIDEIPRAIGQSLEGVERVAKIVRSMKDFSHPGGEAKQAVDLNRALESTLTVCRNEWKYVAEAVTDLDPDLPPVTCLPGECNQVFLNLIINAAHAIGDSLADKSTEKGTITVATRRDGNWAEIRIGDTGIGIPEESRPRIFDPFFTTKEVGRGTGQGLAIAHSVIAEKHLGTINFETEIGRGTTFIVRLPISGES